MRFKKHLINICMAVLLLALVTVFSGCVSVFSPYEGKEVSENNRIPLMQGGPHEGNWETEQVGFRYSYTLRSNTLSISGELFCHAASFWTYEIVDSLVFRISFIDSDAKLIESRILWSLVTDKFFYQWQIKERSLELPPNTAAVGFSYSGSIREGGGTTPHSNGEGVQLDLWYSPLGE